MTGFAGVNQNWQAGMSEEQRALWQEAWDILEVEQTDKREHGKERYADYGFIVFPAAKVYEGFLKNYFYNMGMIAKEAYLSEHFRIGKSLNPDLPNRFRDSTWLFDDVTSVCGEATARQLWEAWKFGRNRIFHYHGDTTGQNLNLLEAEERLRVIQAAMQSAMECERRVKRD
jgi:hypothetical protein